MRYDKLGYSYYTKVIENTKVIIHFGIQELKISYSIDDDGRCAIGKTYEK